MKKDILYLLCAESFIVLLVAGMIIFQIPFISSATFFGPEGFESGTKGAFDTLEVEYGSGTADIDGTSKITGTYSARFGAAGECVGVGRKDLGTDYTELFAQTKILLPTSFIFGASDYIIPLKLQDSVYSDKIAMWLYNDAGTIKIIISGDEDLGWVDTGIVFSKNTTHKIEIYGKLSDTTGRIKIWLDNNVEGSPTYDSTDLNSGTGTIKHLVIGNPYASEAFTDYMYMDDIIVSTTFIGAGEPPPETCWTQLADGSYYVPSGCTCYIGGSTPVFDLNDAYCYED